MDKALSELIAMSRAFGADIRVAWKGGGNLSVKTDDGTMFIKASGTEIGRIRRYRGWREVDIENVRELLKNLLRCRTKPAAIKAGLLDACCDTRTNGAMPSIETFFHSLLGRCVIHLHLMEVLPYLCSKKGQRRLRQILPASLKFNWIAFRGLGVVTAGQIRNCIVRKKLDLKKTQVFFLSNHGVIVSAKSLIDASDVLYKILDCCRDDSSRPKRIKIAAAPKLLTQTAATIRSVCHKYDCSRNRKVVTAGPLYSPDGTMPKKEWLAGVITPEELTYLGGGIVWLEKADAKTIDRAVRAHFKNTGVWPKAFLVAQQGLFVCDEAKDLPLYKKVSVHYLLIRARAFQMGGLRRLVRKYLSGEGL